MKNGNLLSLSIVLLFCVSLIIPTTSVASFASSSNDTPLKHLSENVVTKTTYLDAFEEGLNVRVSNTSLIQDSMTLMSMEFYPNASESIYEEHLIVTDADGNIENALFVPAGAESPKFFNSTTIFYGNVGDDTISLWNILTNSTQDTMAPMGVRDRVHNPITDTFMVIEKVQFTQAPDGGDYASFPVDGNDIVEYDRYGNERWRWNGSLTFPFDIDEFHLRNETESGRIDWMHSNSLLWDIDEGSLYLNVRNLDCVVKIDYETQSTTWVLGRYSGTGNSLDLYNIDGAPVESIFYHAHACKIIGNNRFIIYDNDYWNTTSDNPETGTTRYLEFYVDETAGTASEIWIWNSPTSYYQQNEGNVARLPNGNTIGSFNLSPESVISEVDIDGEIVSEWVFNITETNIGFGIPTNGFTRFFSKPYMEVNTYSELIVEGSDVSIDLSVWDLFNKHYASSGQVLVVEGILEHAALGFQFLPYWQETELLVQFSELVVGIHYLSLLVVNSDGVTSTVVLTIEVIPNYLLIFGVVGSILVVIVSIRYRNRKQNTSISSEP
ncbi:MAG: aryl-sulfate sulfotransferase [Candidatus Thorarchaeota archaeon]